MMAESHKKFQPNLVHIPVMIHEVVDMLDVKAHQTYIDATFGAGGYSQAILEKNPLCSVLAIDCDPDAELRAEAFKAKFGLRFQFVKSKFSHLNTICQDLNVMGIDGIVFDIGVSSPQIDQASRGFSFKHDGPLDMRMTQEGLSAFDVINTYSEEQLADIFYYYGEERAARRVARKICDVRKQAPIVTTHHLATLIRSVVRMAKDRLDPATRTFQGLRIYVNQELDELESGLQAASQALDQNGRLVVVCFHSLEDRIVKKHFVHHSQKHRSVSRYMPVAPMPEPIFDLLTKKALLPSAHEIQINGRASSSRLRAVKKIRETLNL